MTNPLFRPSALRRAATPVLALLALAATSGCALFPRNINPPESVFSDSGLQAPAGSDGKAADNAQLMALLERDLVAAWNALAQATAANEATPANTLLSKGISLIDARCDRYFLALGLAAQKVGFAQKELGLAAGLVGVLQGLTGVAARDMAITAGSFGFAGASSAAYADAFIFSPEVSGVQALVGSAQTAAKARIEQIALADMSRGVAINVLQDYEKTCEVHTIRRLVNESLVAARPVAAFTSDEQPNLPLRLATQDALAAVLKVDQVSDEQLLALYWLTYKPAPANATEQALLANKLGRLPDLVDDVGKLKLDAGASEARKGVTKALRALVLAGTARLDADLAALKLAGLPVAAAPATAPVAGPAGAPGPGPAVAPGSTPASVATPVARRTFAPSLTLRVPSSGR